METASELAPSSALIALNHGYARGAARWRERETRGSSQQDAGTGAESVRSAQSAGDRMGTAGEGGGREVKELAEELVAEAVTPVISRKVAENLLRK